MSRGEISHLAVVLYDAGQIRLDVEVLHPLSEWEVVYVPPIRPIGQVAFLVALGALRAMGVDELAGL